jgi:hypothetical protein
VLARCDREIHILQNDVSRRAHADIFQRDRDPG